MRNRSQTPSKTHFRIVFDFQVQTCSHRQDFQTTRRWLRAVFFDHGDRYIMRERNYLIWLPRQSQRQVLKHFSGGYAVGFFWETIGKIWETISVPQSTLKNIWLTARIRRDLKTQIRLRFDFMSSVSTMSKALQLRHIKHTPMPLPHISDNYCILNRWL